MKQSKTYTPYDVTSSRPRDRKTKIAFFANFRRIEKFENYESVQYRLQFSGIKKEAKISFHRHFKDLVPWQSSRGKVVVPFHWTSGLRLLFIEKKPITVFRSRFQEVDG